MESHVAQASIRVDIIQDWPGHAASRAASGALFWPVILTNYSNNNYFLKSTDAAQFIMELCPNEFFVNRNNCELKIHLMPSV